MRAGIFQSVRGSCRHLLGEQVRRGLVALLTAVVIVSTGALAGGCAIKLAPAFDKSIFDGLTEANVDAMKIFASATSGPFSKRAKAYDDVIGELNAVQVQINARGTPPTPPLLLQLTAAVGDAEAERHLAALSKPPTSADIDNLIEIITETKRADSKGILLRQSRVTHKTRLALFKGAFSVQMAQALTYEKALQR